MSGVETNVLIIICFVVFFGLVAVLALIGLGAFVLTHCKLDVLPIEAFGVGLGTALGTLEIYQLFRPIDFLVVICLFLIGFVELARRPTLYYLLVLPVRSIRVSRIAFGLFLMLSLAIRSAGPCQHYDTGLYGANTVRWFTTYSIVPGLANLHGRFGFNSSLFLLVAAFNKVLGSLSYRILDGIFIAILAILIVAAIDRLLCNTSRPEDLYLLILTIPVVYWVERAELVGTNTDLPSTICCLLAVYFAFATVSSKAKGMAPLRLFSACVLFSAAVVLKLSTIVLAGLGFVICISVFLSFPETRAKRRHWIIATMVLCAFVVIPWVIRGYILSGYPFYPNASFGAGVDWRVPTESTTMVKLGIRAWARMRQATIPQADGWHWFAPWLKEYWSDRVDFLIPLLIVFCGLALLVVHKSPKRQLQQLVLVLPCIAGMAFWFLAAPDPRFGQAAMWGAAALLGAIGLGPWAETGGARPKLLVAAVLCVAVWCVYPRSLWIFSYRRLFTAHDFSPLPKPETKILTTRSGLDVWIPTKGVQCWDSPLPCSAYFNNNLELRKPGNLQSGFRSVTFPSGAEWVIRTDSDQTRPR